MASRYKPSTSRPEIKMTRTTQLRQKPLQTSTRTKSKSDITSPTSSSTRSSLGSNSGSNTKLSKTRGPTISTSSIDSGRHSSSERLYTSSSSLSSDYTPYRNKKRHSIPGMSVVDRLYQPPDPKFLNYLTRTNRNLPDFERRSRELDELMKREPKFPFQRSKGKNGNGRARSMEDICDISQPVEVVEKRKYSDQRGVPSAEKSLKRLEGEVDDGVKQMGLPFVDKYFRDCWNLLSPQVDSYLTRKNLGPRLSVATNEERYMMETPSIILFPQSIETFEELYVDLLDIPVGEITMDKFSSFVRYLDGPLEKTAQPSVLDVSIQTDLTESDAWTNTDKPVMVNRLLETRLVNDTATSTEDLKRFVIPRVTHCVSTSTFDLPQPLRYLEAGTSTSDLSDYSPTPRASPVSMVEDEVEESSAYGSLSSGSLKTLLDKINSQDSGNNKVEARRKRVSKAIMTDDEASDIHNELSRLANERIEIIELLALNILNLPSSLSVELLEAKLNYSIGQTDQLLAMLEDSWNADTERHNSLLALITQRIIEQSKRELDESKKAIKMSLDEVRYVRSKGHSRRNFNREIMKMKRRAEIEAFKVERMWEQLFYEKNKRHDHMLRESFNRDFRGPKYDTALDTMKDYVSYMPDLRHNVMTASQDDMRDLYSSYYDHDSSWDTGSITSTSSRTSTGMPRHNRDYLLDLRRKIVTDTDRSAPLYTYPHWGSSSNYFRTSYPLGDSSFRRESRDWQSTNSSGLPTYHSAYNSSEESSKTTYYSSSNPSTSFHRTASDLLTPSRPSYRSAGRYSVR